jgi:hypothetical protein
VNEELFLEPGWLKRQMDEVRENVSKWPDCLKPMLHINEEITKKYREDAPAKLP